MTCESSITKHLVRRLDRHWDIFQISYSSNKFYSFVFFFFLFRESRLALIRFLHIISLLYFAPVAVPCDFWMLLWCRWLLIRRSTWFVLDNFSFNEFFINICQPNTWTDPICLSLCSILLLHVCMDNRLSLFSIFCSFVVDDYIAYSFLVWELNCVTV